MAKTMRLPPGQKPPRRPQRRSPRLTSSKIPPAPPPPPVMRAPKRRGPPKGKKFGPRLPNVYTEKGKANLFNQAFKFNRRDKKHKIALANTRYHIFKVVAAPMIDRTQALKRGGYKRVLTTDKQVDEEIAKFRKIYNRKHGLGE